MKKKLIKFTLMLVMMLSCISFQSVLATSNGLEKNIDSTPPTGRISVLSAEDDGGISYVENREIEVMVYATDDSTSEEIKIYFSTEPISNAEKIADSLWEQYTDGFTKKLSLPKGSYTATIYVALKDKRGNISTIFTGTNTQYNLVYNANGGVNAPASQVGYFGMPFKVTMDRPTYEGKYFMGWSTSSTATVPSYIQGSTIPAEIFVGTTKNITLYAVWADTIQELPLLADRVKVGDYVNYPVYYENINSHPASGTYKSNYEGWRVLSIEADGTINLVSAGAPLTYLSGTTSSTAVDNLTNNFLKIPFSTATSNTYIKSGFTSYVTLQEAFTNKYTLMKTDGKTPEVRAINVEDALEVVNNVSITLGMSLADERYDGLFKNNAVYYLATQNGTNNLWGIDINGAANSYGNSEIGIRPVVSLKPTVATTGVNNIGAWDIEVEVSNAEEEVNEYTITFNANGGTPDTQTKVITGERTYGILPTVTRTGYTFTGWYTQASGGTKISATTTLIENSNHTIYAQWTAIPYTITYNLDGGNVATANPTGYNAETATFTLNNPTKTGYTFAGWTGTGLSSATQTVTIPEGSTGNRSYTATWTANTNTEYTVQHWLQNVGGEDTENGTNYKLTSDNIQNLTGTTGVSVTPAVKTYAGFTSPSTKTVTIKADGTTVVDYYYKRNEYKLTLTAGANVSSVSGTGTYEFGESVTIDAVLGNEAGYTYTFTGWTLDGTVSQTTQKASIVMPAEDITLVATATKVASEYTVTFNANGGSVSPTSIKVTYGSTYGTLPTPTNESYYTFLGWYTSLTGGTVVTEASILTEPSAQTIYARWRDDSITVTYSTIVGTLEYTSKKINKNGTYGTFPTVTYGTHPVSGWYLEATFETEITSTTAIQISSDHTVYAKWENSPPVVKVVSEEYILGDTKVTQEISDPDGDPLMYKLSENAEWIEVTDEDGNPLSSITIEGESERVGPGMFGQTIPQPVDPTPYYFSDGIETIYCEIYDSEAPW